MARINSKDTKMKAERIKDKEGGGRGGGGGKGGGRLRPRGGGIDRRKMRAKDGVGDRTFCRRCPERLMRMNAAAGILKRQF